jgi:hypothetical protein
MSLTRNEFYRTLLATRRVRNAINELESLSKRLGVSCHVADNRVWVETAQMAFIFRNAHFTRSKVHEFKEWWFQANTIDDLKTLPFGITARKIHRDRDWSKFPGASIKSLAPASPIRPVAHSVGNGSHSTVPGHLAELNIYDLQKR